MEIELNRNIRQPVNPGESEWSQIKESPSPIVTVIIPVYNAGSQLMQTINSVAVQDYSNMEIIVIDDHSSDSEILRAGAQHWTRPVLVVNHPENRGLASSLNDGLKRSSGSLVMTLHQDSELVQNDWISQAVERLLREPNTAVVTGRPIYPLSEFSSIQKAYAILEALNENETSVEREEVAFSEDKCDVYRKDVLLSVGGFHEQRFRISGEDQFLSNAIRLKGYAIVRDNRLHCVQRLGPGIHSWTSILKKTYNFGKTQVGISTSGGLSSVRAAYNTKSQRGRVLNRVTSLLFVIACVIALAFVTIHAWTIGLTVVGIGLVSRIIFLLTRDKTALSRLDPAGLIALLILSPLSDIIYAMGCVVGTVFLMLGRRL